MLGTKVNPGYKQTEVGVIPEDWDIIPLSSCALGTMQNGLFFKPSLKGTGVKLINVGDLYQRAPINSELLELFGANSNECERFGVRDGDIFFTRSSIVPSGIAHCNIFRSNTSECVVFDSHVIRLRPDVNKVVSAYLFRACVGEIARSFLVSHAKTGTMTTIDQKVLGKCPVLLPHTKLEQEAIAEALSDADTLIESLEKLIFKKRLIKQAAMQELLRPKKKWKEEKLGNLGVFLKGSGIKKDEAISGAIPCVRYGEIYTHHNEWVRDFYSWISPNVARTATLLKRGDILFAGSGETKEEIGKCVAFLSEIKAYAGGDVVILRPQKADSAFLGYYLNSPSITRQKASRGQGDAIVHIGSASLSDIDILLPSAEEQAEIASILSDLDSELSALEQKLSKARQIKQGMMQELLTGRIRLI